MTHGGRSSLDVARPRSIPRTKRREPRALEASYVAKLSGIWATVHGIIAYGLSPLFDLWPTSEQADSRQDIVIPKTPPRRVPRNVRYNPLSPRALLPRIWNLSDADLAHLWPGIEPADVRLYAPWAVTHNEVGRIAYPGGLPADTDLEEYVRRAIAAERARAPVQMNLFGDDPPTVRKRLRRPPGAFRLQPRTYAPTILGTDGLPIPLPPRPRIISEEIIEKQVAWVDMAVGRAVTVENLVESIGPTGERVASWNRVELERVLSIDLRATDPNVANYIDGWRNRNVGLIESGLMAKDASPRLRPSLLEDVSETIERAHREGVRVEVLANDLVERFDVSKARAELIARDQVLKLNGQVTKQRQMSAGITKYRWSTSLDGAVRDTHAALEGTIQSWDSPPEVAPGRFEHPGMDFQCRCVAIPILPGEE